MKIITFNTRDDEMDSFTEFSKGLNQDITHLKERFSPETAHLAEGYEAISIVGSCIASQDAIQKIAKLGIKYISTRTTGYDNIDLETAKENNIRVTHVPAYSPNAVAEFVVLGALSLARNLNKITDNVENHNFSLEGLLGFELRNKVIGVIGTGRIGTEVIKTFSGFGSKIIGHDPYENEEAKKYITYKSLDEVFAEADIITLHCPLTEKNKHLINDENIQKMKDGVIIINAARGELVNSLSMIKGLESGKIAGFFMDVYENEEGIFHHNISSLKDNVLIRLMEFPNVLITPHCAFYTDEAVSNMVEIALNNIYELHSKGSCLNELVNQPS